MRFVRFLSPDGKEVSGILENNVVQVITEKPWLGTWKRIGVSFSLRDIELLVPCDPGKIIGVAQNYTKSEREDLSNLEPIIFLKTPDTLLRADKKLTLPGGSEEIWGEAELAYVIGVDKSSALGLSIFGYFIVNDITRSNLGGYDHHLAYSKSARGFCPVSTFIDNSFSPANQHIRAFHNGKLLREGRLSDRMMNDYTILEKLSKWMPLSPGDVILTGTPHRIRERQYLCSGDTFDCVISGLDSLQTKIR